MRPQETEAAPSHYLMESPLEALRLEAKTNEEETRRQLELVGLAEGMHAIDVGAGTGAVARVMSRVVGAHGRVVAFDASAARLRFGARKAESLGIENLSFATGDVYAPPLQPESFDLVWCRFLFEYLREPDLAMAELVRLARPGGKVVAGDLDGNGVFHYPCPPRLQEGLQKLERFLQGHLDPYAGRKLFHRFRRAGLERIEVHLLPYHLYAGTASPADQRNWTVKFQTLRPVGALAFGGVDEYEEFARAFLEHLQDPDSFTYSTLVLVEGVRADSQVR